MSPALTVGIRHRARHKHDPFQTIPRTSPSGTNRPRVVPPLARSLALQRLAADEPFVAPEGDLSARYRLAKRALDIIGALCLLVVLGPAMLGILLVLAVTTQGRPLYAQTRVGYRGRCFRIWKFRTMRLDADRLQHTVTNEVGGPVFKNRRDPRVTRLGRVLRKTSLDETPQLFHVLLGDMTLVGPRPLAVQEVAKIEPWQRRRHAVKPGLTCLWQVSGRSEIGFADWVRMDLWYVRNQGLWTDLKLMLRTPAAVILGRGAY